ncbi:NAD(P)H-binding protein [Bradyrhizobium sp. USDA 4473]
MTQPLILVTGATGNVGTHLVPLLLEGGARVRVLTRDPDRAAKFDGEVEVVQGDLEVPHTLPPAFAGVDKAFVLAAGLNIGVMEGNAFDTAKAAGVSHIVSLIGRHVNADFMADVPHAQARAKSEQHLQSLGVGWTILRPCIFASNFLMWLDRAEGRISVPAGEGMDSFIDPYDIAACAAKLLTTPGHDGVIYEVSGAERISFAQAADKIGQAIGRIITYHDVRADAWRQAMLNFGAPESDVDFILRYFASVKAGRMYPPTQAVADLLGRPPRTFSEWATNSAAALRG